MAAAYLIRLSVASGSETLSGYVVATTESDIKLGRRHKARQFTSMDDYFELLRLLDKGGHLPNATIEIEPLVGDSLQHKQQVEAMIPIQIPVKWKH